MSNSDPRLNRTRVPLYLVDENGRDREYQTRPLSDGDMDEINAWLRSEYLRRIEEGLKGVQNPKVADLMLDRALSTVTTIDFLDNGPGSKMVGTVDGLSRLLWQSMREDHPELTHERLKLILMQPENVKRGQRHWIQTNLGAGREAKKPAGEPGRGREEPRRRKPRRRPKSTGR